MNDADELSELDEIAEAALEEQYRNGTHYDRNWLREHAVKAGPGPNPLMKVVVDLGVGDSVERLDSTKDKKVWGPQSVEVVYWPDGGIDQNLYELGKAPEMPRNTFDGRYIDPNAAKAGRKVGQYYDKDTFDWDGETKTAREWYDHPRRIEGLAFPTFRNRLKQQGMTVEEALTQPVARGGRRATKKKQS
ncbi:hypothetical protein ACIOEX_30350 [Streptomyces sp. NPDC087850]|uniref:hypothetical protein n=1 Tax=Streptomyces sp. NPDC087850 TaxID=3365809 RepID=UPI003828AF84